MHVVFSEQGHRYCNVVNVLKDQSATFSVLLFSSDEVEGMIAPVAAGIEVMGGVVAVVEAVSKFFEY